MDDGGFTVQLSYLQIMIMVTTLVLMVCFTQFINTTSLGRQQRACEQDKTMAALLGVNVDRTVSMTFVMGAALAAVAGVMVTLYYGVVDFFLGFLAGLQAFTRSEARRVGQECVGTGRSRGWRYH